MGKIMIINGSPRAPKSNSKKFAYIFAKNCKIPTEYFELNKKNNKNICMIMDDFTDILLIFPLYVDGIPVTLLNFLKVLENNPPKKKPKISILINCGFIEPEQNDVAVKMVRFFCKTQGYVFGSLLKIGSGEAILNTPFKIFVVKKIKKLAKTISKEKNENLKITMPLPKKLFIKASTKYWENYGKRNGITKEQMSIMEIEKE